MIEINVEDILKKFNELDSKNQKKAYSNAIRKALGILIKETRSNLKEVVNVTNQASTRKQFKGKNLLRGITMRLKKDKTGGTVAITSDPRLIFFEQGTEVRSTKEKIGRKSHNTGSIEETDFFTNARTETETQIFSDLETILMSSIDKTWNRNNK